MEEDNRPNSTRKDGDSVYYDDVSKQSLTKEQVIGYLNTLEEAIASVRRSVVFWDVMLELNTPQASEKLIQLADDYDLLVNVRAHYQSVLKMGPSVTPKGEFDVRSLR